MKNKGRFIYNSFNPDPFHTHMKLLNLIPAYSSVLEVGCATGYFTKELLKKNCRVIAIEKDKLNANIAKKNTNAKIIVADVNDLGQVLSNKQKFDVILLADVLEHLTSPIGTLVNLKKYLNNKGKILISVPNIANFSVRLQLFIGKFNYQDYGILDKTHLHLYTKKTIEDLLNQVGLKIINFDVVSGLEVSIIYRKTIGRLIFRIKLLRTLEYIITKMFPGLFALEFIYEARN